jgi:hypothetical protein
MTIRLFTGYDARESIGWHTFLQSVAELCGPEVAVTSLSAPQRDGSNAFTYARFKIPLLMDYDGFAIFVDGSDMLLRADIAELWALRDDTKAVQVVKHDYQTRHARKYIGTEMETANDDYPRKNWSSVIIWNCGHVAHFDNRTAIEYGDGKYLHRFGWLKDEEIGELPVEWNWLADEYGHNPEAKLLHWTAGHPGFYHYKNAPHSGEWETSVRNVMKGLD